MLFWRSCEDNRFSVAEIDVSSAFKNSPAGARLGLPVEFGATAETVGCAVDLKSAGCGLTTEAKDCVARRMRLAWALFCACSFVERFSSNRLGEAADAGVLLLDIGDKLVEKELAASVESVAADVVCIPSGAARSPSFNASGFGPAIETFVKLRGGACGIRASEGEGSPGGITSAPCCTWTGELALLVAWCEETAATLAAVRSVSSVGEEGSPSSCSFACTPVAPMLTSCAASTSEPAPKLNPARIKERETSGCEFDTSPLGLGAHWFSGWRLDVVDKFSVG